MKRKFSECVTCGMMIINSIEEIDSHNKEIDHDKIAYDINGESLEEEQ